MNKYLKVLIANTLLFVSLIYSFQGDISYGQSNNMDMLISITKQEEDLNNKIKDLDCILKNENQNIILSNDMEGSLLERKINIDILKYSQIKFLKMFFERQLMNCEKSESLLIKEIKKEKEETLKNSNAIYIKGEWPLENYRYISSGYGYRIHPITKKINFHNGIDIPAPKNTSVLASDDGIVNFAGYKNGYGYVVEIEHFDNKKTLYAHNDSIAVKEGQIVKRGEAIAKVGSTGNSTGNHVHFEVRINDKRINPLYGIGNNYK
ncbi:M23 family metallopeptidase [Terrisporobacter glycolicus]|uniref:M23ase beta-sheet core domain-containing protein n=1 Tax=Terrisporobacter glycolicus ATCC 14880 = DSM 1288 TaxID=1121315 RepID=A0ABZ2EXK9_9FIRM|nr:M23 family metallopeptidase [Terrisporobacter glycolicus]